MEIKESERTRICLHRVIRHTDPVQQTGSTFTERVDALGRQRQLPSVDGQRLQTHLAIAGSIQPVTYGRKGAPGIATTAGMKSIISRGRFAMGEADAEKPVARKT